MALSAEGEGPDPATALAFTTESPSDEANPVSLEAAGVVGGNAGLIDSFTSEAAQSSTPVKTIFLGFENELAGWTTSEAGGSEIGRGGVDVGSAVLTEGDSFLVTLERGLTVPGQAQAITFRYTDLSFDTADPEFINDAFEVSLLDADGNTLVHTFSPDRDAFFNATEEETIVVGSGTTVSEGAITKVDVDISTLFPATEATLQFRLVNNDSDVNTSVRLLDVAIVGADEPPTATVELENDTAPTGPGSDPYRSDRLTNDPTVYGTATDDFGISMLEASVDGETFQDITTTLVDGQFSFDPGSLLPGPHTITIRGTDTLGQTTDATMDFTVNSPPFADAGGNRTVGEGSEVNFNGSASSDVEGPIFAYQWTLDDGTTVDGVSTSRPYPQDGIFPVSLTVTDTAGSVVTDYIEVAVENLPPLIDAIDDQQSNEGEAITFTTSFADPGVMDAHSALIDWGDSTVEEAPIEEDNGAGTVSGTHVYRDNGTYDVTVTVTDDGNETADVSFTVVVRNLAPTVLSVNDLSGQEGEDLDSIGTFSDPGVLDTHTATIYWSDGTTSLGDVTESGGQGAVTGNHVFADNGVYPVFLEVTDNAGDSDTLGATAQIANVAPEVTATPTEQSVQYSDPISPVTITASDVPADTLTATTSYSKDRGLWTEGLPNGTAFSGSYADGLGTWTISGIADVEPADYSVRVSVADEDGGVTDTDVMIAVMQEDAVITYCGVPFVSTSSVNNSEASVLLRAIVQDYTAAYPAVDPDPGDVRYATVSFVHRETGQVIASGIPVGLMDETDSQTGIASYEWTVDLGNADSKSYTIGTIVDGYYAANSAADDTVITVSKPLSNFITGGGYFINEDSAGEYAGDPGLRTNFGFNVKFNKKLTNLQGRVNIIVRQDDHVYQIKSNATTSLVVDPYTEHAVFTSKANLRDVTDPANPISLGGNLLLEMSITDRGEPGTYDSIGITLWTKDNDLLYSSLLVGLTTSEQAIDGGNLVVHKERGFEQHATKFFVPDSETDGVFRYTDQGSENGSFSLDALVADPRGATSNAVGDTVWVVDAATQKVFVCNPDALVRGSWVAEGLEGPQGIATDGEDIWIVDAQRDEVLRYARAALLTSGVATVAGSFALRSENDRASGIATDGSTIWISDEETDVLRQLPFPFSDN